MDAVVCVCVRVCVCACMHVRVRLCVREQGLCGGLRTGKATRR
jgi:hypothetical protein